MTFKLGLIAALFLAAGAQAATVVPGTADPKLAGMPDGSTASSGDVAPAQSPVLWSEFALQPGSWLQISATGSVGNCQGCNSPTPDGEGLTSNGPENGISGVTAPLNSLLGVFLGPSRPDGMAAPAALDFSGSGTEFTAIEPLLQQVFFIGDGVTGTGMAQTFRVPLGATRLYLATQDGYGWYNNVGEFSVTVSSVPEPASVALMLGGLGLAGLVRRRRAGY